MQINQKRLKIPMDELLFIYPDARERLFLDMIDEYKKRFPQFKLIYAYLNRDASIGVDYLIIFEAIGQQTHQKTIIYDIPYIYTDRSIPGYRYCKREGLLDDFFYDSSHLMVTTPKIRFEEYLNSFLNLSNHKDDELYWKSPSNSLAVARGLSNLSLYYVRKD